MQIKVARTEICRVLARANLLLSFAESNAFEDYIKKPYNPKFTPLTNIHIQLILEVI